MHSELIAYSSQPDLKLSDFKKGNYDIQNLDQKLIDYCQEHNILGITQKDSWYPPQLRNYSDSPYLFITKETSISSKKKNSESCDQDSPLPMH